MTDKDSLILMQTQDDLTAVLCRIGFKKREVVQLRRIPLTDRTFSEAIRALMEALSLPKRPEDVRLCLDADNTLFRSWSFPFRSRVKIEQALALLLDTEFPFGADGLEHRTAFAASGARAGAGNAGSGGRNASVLSVSIFRERLTGWLDACAENGLFPRLVTPAPFPLVTALPKLAGSSLLVQLQERHAILALLDGNALVRVCPVTLEHSEKTSDATACFPTLARDAALMLEGLALRPERLLAYGTPLFRSGTDSRLSEAFALPVTVLGRDLPLCGQMTRLGETDADSLLGLCAAVMPLPSPMRQTVFPSFHRKQADTTGNGGRWLAPLCTALAIGAAFLCSVWAEGNALHRQAQGHETAARDLFRQAVPDVRGTFGPTQMESILKTRIAAMRGPQTEQKAFPVLHLLHSLHAAAPTGTELRLDRITLDARHCTISGTADSYDQINRLRDALTGISGIREAKILNAANQTGKNAAAGVLFELDLVLEGGQS